MSLPIPNFTMNPNVLVDEWCSRLSGSEFKVLMVLARKIYGWHKTSDAISVNQLCKVTGLSRQSVMSASIVLEKHGLIIKTSCHVGNEHLPSSYQLNVIKPVDILYTDSEPAEGGSLKIRQGVVQKLDGGVVQKLDPQKKHSTKENLNKEKKNKKDETPAIAVALCDFFLSEIKKRKANTTQKITDEWTNSAKKLLALRSPDEIRKLIEFGFAHDFWFSKVLTPTKLLKHIDAIELEMSKNKSSPQSSSPMKREGENRSLASKIEKEFPDAVRKGLIYIAPSYIEFAFEGYQPSQCIKYTDHGFDEQVHNGLRKLNLTLRA